MTSDEAARVPAGGEASAPQPSSRQFGLRAMDRIVDAASTRVTVE